MLDPFAVYILVGCIAILVLGIAAKTSLDENFQTAG
jgi:hypothetical protein